MMREALGQVVAGKNLSAETAQNVMREMISGAASPSQIGAFLTAMRMKGETEDEIRGFVIAMRGASLRIEAPQDAVDLCGTGGDGAGTFNISTAASFVVAAAGVPVAKHGNRSVSSKCGSADLLGSLGIPFSLPPALVQESLSGCGLGFMFAPVFHHSMKNVMVPRREIGFRTVFNLLGPLTNPACVKNQLVGVYDGSLAPTIVRVLKDLGTARALVVHSAGMDEITNTGPTRIHELMDGSIKTYDIEPSDFGFDFAEPSEIGGGDAAQNARIVYSILKGERSPRRDVVALNATAAIYASGRTSSMAEACDLAVATLDSGRALIKAKEFASLSCELERRWQSASGVSSFAEGRIHSDVLVKRAAEITRYLRDEVLRCPGGAEMLSVLEPSLISDPNVLSVLVMRRVRSILSNSDRVEQLSVAQGRKRMKLSDAIASSEGIAVVAEFKPRSPSSTGLTVPPDPAQVARTYTSSGVSGVSVLVEPDFFSGSETLFAEMRSLVGLPMLFKDFVVTEAQIDRASLLGADAILLVAKALTTRSLSTFVDRCVSVGVEPLVEVHDEEDILKLLDSGCMESVRLVGINSRDLRSLRTDLSGMSRLREMVGSGKTVVAESGLTKPSDLNAIRGFDAVLIGSAFMNAEDMAQKVREVVTACRGLT